MMQVMERNLKLGGSVIENTQKWKERQSKRGEIHIPGIRIRYGVMGRKYTCKGDFLASSWLSTVALQPMWTPLLE